MKIRITFAFGLFAALLSLDAGPPGKENERPSDDQRRERSRRQLELSGILCSVLFAAGQIFQADVPELNYRPVSMILKRQQPLAVGVLSIEVH